MIQNYQVCRLPTNDPQWISFAESFPYANIFQNPVWIDLLAECYGYKPFILALKDDIDQIHAVIPLIEINSILTGKRWVSLPFSDYSIPLYKDEESLERLSQELAVLYKEKNLSLMEIRWKIPAESSFQFNSQFYLHQLHLDRDPENVMKKFHRTQRQNIHTAEKNNVEIEWGQNLEYLREFYHLHCLTRRRQGVPVQPWHFFELILRRIIERDLGFILLARAQGQCLAAGLFLHWGKTLTYKYASSSEILQNLRPNHLLTWTAIRWACENSFTIFDFGRTDKSNEGLRTYKTRWGVEETELVYSTTSLKKQQHTSGKFTVLVEKFIQKSPIWVCKLSGEVLYRHFG